MVLDEDAVPHAHVMTMSCESVLSAVIVVLGYESTMAPVVDEDETACSRWQRAAQVADGPAVMQTRSKWHDHALLDTLDDAVTAPSVPAVVPASPPKRHLRVNVGVLVTDATPNNIRR